MALVSFKPFTVARSPIGRELSLVLAAAHHALRLSVASLAVGASNAHRIQRVEHGTAMALSCLAQMQGQIQGVVERVGTLGARLAHLQACHERVAAVAAQSAQQIRLHEEALRVHSLAISRIAGRVVRADYIVDLLSSFGAILAAALAGTPLRWGAFVVLHALYGPSSPGSHQKMLTRFAIAASQCLVFAFAVRALRVLAAHAGLRSIVPASTAGPLGAIIDCWRLFVGESGASSFRASTAAEETGLPSSGAARPQIP